jgi:hypothetical protein
MQKDTHLQLQGISQIIHGNYKKLRGRDTSENTRELEIALVKSKLNLSVSFYFNFEDK